MPREEREDEQGASVLGSRADRAVLDLALSVHGAVLWRYRFAGDELTWSSAGLERLLAMPGADEQPLRNRLRELLNPLIVSASAAPVWQDLELEQSFEDAGGVLRWIRFRARPVGPERPDQLVGIATDARAGGEDARQLAIMADRYRLLTELSPDAICVHQEGVLTYVNPATVRLLRADSDEQLLGHPISEFIARPSLGELRQRVAGLTEPGMASEPAPVQDISGGKQRFHRSKLMRTGVPLRLAKRWRIWLGKGWRTHEMTARPFSQNSGAVCSNWKTAERVGSDSNVPHIISPPLNAVHVTRRHIAYCVVAL